MASKTITNPDGTTKRVLVGSKADPDVQNKTTVKTKPSKKITDLSISLADEYYKKNPQLAKSGGYRGKVDTNALLKKKGPSAALKNLSVNLAKGNVTSTSATNAATTKGVTDASKGPKPLGSGTPLTDDEIDALAKQGFREGDFVPGRGRLLPDGTFDISGLTMAQNLRKQEETPVKGAVVSDAPIVKQEQSAINTVTNAGITSPSKDALALLDEEMKNIREDLRSSEKTIKSSAKVQEQQLQDKQAQESGRTSVALAEAGGYLGFSGSAQGVMLSLAQSHRAELADLAAKRDQLIQQAREAAADRRFDLVKAKANEIARLDQETYERQETYNERVRKEAEKEQLKQEKLQVQGSINDAIQYLRSNGTNNFTPEDLFNELNGTVDIKEINDFLTGITKNSTGAFKFSSNETANLLGTGMSADDISALADYVNENGYDEKIRGALTPSQRAAADKIYGLKSGKTDGGVAFVTKDGVSVSNLTSQVLDGFTKISSLTPTMEAKVRAELYNLGFGSSKVPSWFDYDTAVELLGADVSEVEDSKALLDYYVANNLSDYRGGKITKRAPLSEIWEQFRNTILSDDSNIKGTADSSGIPTDINDL